MIEEITLLMTVQLMFFSQSRLSIFLDLPLHLDRDIPSGVLIESGVQLYEGGNVMIYLLTSDVFLFSFLCWTHLLFGMFSYNWIHCLLLFDLLMFLLLNCNASHCSYSLSLEETPLLLILAYKLSLIFGQPS